MQINLKALKAINLFASKEETRYYLNGVNLRFEAGFIYMEATNGHYYSVIRHKIEETQDLPNVIVPRSLIEKIKLDRKWGDFAEYTLENDKVTIDYAGVTYREGRVDATYPDTKRIVPETVSGEIAQFNYDFSALFVKAGKMLGREIITIGHNGGSPALVDWLPEDFEGFGVLMPMRTSDALKASPAWSRYPKSNAA